MQAKKRFFILLFLLVCIFGYFTKRMRRKYYEENLNFENLPSFLNEWDNESSGSDYSQPTLDYGKNAKMSFTSDKCRMKNCFDFSRCHTDFKVYVYPTSEDNIESSPSRSILYQKILDVISESRYYTSDPEKACLLVTAIDTLDRDHLSPDYVRNVQTKLKKLKHWNGGENHIIFNLYSGTWPNYVEDDLGFDTGKAILAKASMSTSSLRPKFDVSIPLFTKSHAERGGEKGLVNTNSFPCKKKYLLAFKGKRYLRGIGSEIRNSLYHVNNEKDIVFVTTCKHGRSWENWKDERCDVDNILYEKYDYDVLLQNSTFCLVPRGRRLGSFRFLESLQAGCIPVLLSNGWALPFVEVIDWNKAAIWADERLLLQVPEMVRSIPDAKIHFMRQQTQILWDQYFSSIEKIVFTTFEIIKERLPFQQSRDGLVWNTSPGGLLAQFKLSHSMHHYPFNNDLLGLTPHPNFTAVIYSQLSRPLTVNTPVYRLLRNLAKSQFVCKIVVVWYNENQLSSQIKWPTLTRVPFTVLQLTEGMHRFRPLVEIKTEAVLSLDEDAVLTTEEIDFAFQVWKSFPEQIVGYPARSHYWDEFKESWGYTSKWTNEYSIVLTGAAFYHNYYNILYTEWLSPLLIKTVEQSNNCEDILMNFLVSHVTKKPPIKVTQRKKFKEQMTGSSFSKSPWNDPDHFVQRQTCLNTFVALFGYMPLIHSSLRLDPILFKDPVSNLRKKYRQMEIVEN